MSDTPISDAARMREKNGCVTTFQGVEIVPAELARQLERELNLRNQELGALKHLIVEELNEAGIWETFDGEELHTGNWIQGLRLLKREFLNGERLKHDIISQRAADSKRLDWVMKTLALNALPLDQWDRDNIDDAINREEPK